MMMQAAVSRPRQWAAAILLAAFAVVAQAEPGLHADNKKALRTKLLDTPAAKVTLPSLSDKELSDIRHANANEKMYVVGVGRGLGARNKIGLQTLAWPTAADGTRYSSVEFQSTGASAVRLALDPLALPKGVTLYVYGALESDKVYGPYTWRDVRQLGVNDSPYWLPVIEGDTVRIELQADQSAALQSAALGVPQLSHLIASMRTGLDKNLGDLNRSGTCNIDIACPPSNSTWYNRGQSVAKYYLTDSLGRTGACTGTYVVPSATPPGVPLPNYFVTANHCISTTAEANSMHFYWFFERQVCTSPVTNPTSVTQTVGGAIYMRDVVANDMTLVSLNTAPPAGATPAAWGAAVSTAAGNTMVTLHHPAGDVKKYSSGTHQGFTAYLSNTVNASANHIMMLWTQGTTEGGSSGAPLFNANGQIVGTLHGGDASCLNLTGRDWYGRFDQAYTAQLGRFLSPTGAHPAPEPPTAPPPPAAPIDISLNSAVNGSVALNGSVWYRVTTNSTHNSLTVTINNLSADADLYVFRNNQGTSPEDCASEQVGMTADTCTFPAPGTTTWYIEVYGYQAANYTLTASVPTGLGGGGGNNDDGGGAFDLELLALLSLALMLSLTRRVLRVRR